MNKDQIKGRIKEVRGIVKETAGKVSGKEILEQKGKLLKTVGKAQARIGDVKNDATDDE